MKNEFIGVVAGKSGEAIAKEVKKWGAKVALISGKVNEPGTDTADCCLCIDLSEQQRILEFFKSKNVNKVIFGTGHILALELAEFLSQNGVLVNIIPEVSKLCNNKYELKKKAEEIGLRTPKYCIVSKEDDINIILKEWKFPFVVKSIRDYVQPQLIHDKTALDIALKALFCNEPTVMFEQYIKGNDCSVVVSNSCDAVKALGVIYWSKANEDKLKGFFESFSKPLKKEIEEKVKLDAVRLVDYINVLGLPRVDIIVEDNIPYILEINSIIFSRNSGTTYTILSRRNGINSAKIIVENAIKFFSLKTKETYKKVNDVLVFADETFSNENIVDVNQNKYEIEIGIPRVDRDYLFPDVIKDINNFLSNNGTILDKNDNEILLKYISCINIKNPDYVLNMCSEERKKIIDLAIQYLNKSEMHYHQIMKGI